MVPFVCTLLLCTLALVTPANAAPPDVTYQTIDVDFPLTAFTVVTAALPGPHGSLTLAGGYWDSANQKLHGFVRQSHGVTIPLLGHAVQDGSAYGLTGSFLAPAFTPAGGLFTWGFVYHNGTVETLTGPSLGIRQPPTMRVEPFSINDAGLVCGAWLHPVDGQDHGFLYDRTATPRYTMIDVPSAVSTACLHVAQDGRLLIRSIASDGTKSYWVWTAGTFAPLTIPDVPNADLVAHHNGIIAGNIGTKGFVWDRTTVQNIEVPSSTLTEISGLLVVGDTIRVYGRYSGTDGVDHGFLATLDLSEASRRGKKR